MPLPAVAWRYCAMRGASLEPGGCSATPTSACAACRARWPALVAPPAPGSAAALAIGVAPATPDWPASSEENCVAVSPTGVVGPGAVGCRPCCSSAIRVSTASTLISPVIGRPRPSFNGRGHQTDRGAPSQPPLDADPSPEGWRPPELGDPVVLAQEAQHALRGLVGLREHGRAGLREDLVLGQGDHLLRHVHVADPRLGAGQVLLVRGLHRQGVLEAVLHGAVGGARGA